MKIFGHCRFSYFGRTDTGRTIKTVEDAQNLLWNAERMAVRFHLFENIMLPSLMAQTDQDFQFVLTTSNEMPDIYQTRLDQVVSLMPNARVVRTSERNIGRALRPIMIEASDGNEREAVHFRIDDDDAVGISYVEKLRACSKTLPPSSMITFGKGLMAHFDGDTVRHSVSNQPSIAIGLAFVNAATNNRNPFSISQRGYGLNNIVYADATFPAYHYTRHTTNNSYGYQKSIHKSGDLIEKVALKMRQKHPEFATGAVTTEDSEDMISQAFPYTSGAELRSIIERTLTPETLPAFYPS